MGQEGRVFEISKGLSSFRVNVEVKVIFNGTEEKL